MFLAGALLIQSLANLPSLGWAVLLLPLALVAIRWPSVGLPLLFFAGGFAWAAFRAGLIMQQALPDRLEGVDVEVEGRVADLPVAGDRAVRFEFAVIRAARHGHEVAVPDRILLANYGKPGDYRVGDLWRFTVRLKRPHGFQNPGGFDYESYLFQHRIRATGYVRESPAPTRIMGLTETSDWLLGYRINRLRQNLSANIRAMIPDHPFSAMVIAFANGDDDSIQPDQWRVLTRTGISHLVAISGMNIGLIAGLCFVLVRRLWVRLGRAPLRIPASRAAAIGALFVAAVYSALAGFAIPTQRALAMLSVGLTSQWVGRRLGPSVPMALALMAVLIVDPLAVLSAGFWLSFLAVAAILWVAHGLPSAQWRDRIRAWGSVQLAITVGLVPVLLYLFQQVSVVSPLANLVAIPVVEMIVIPATLAGVASSLVFPDWVSVVPFRFAADVLKWLWPVLEWLATSRFAIWVQAPPPWWAMVAATAGIAVVMMPRGLPMRWTGIFWCLPLIFHRPPVPDPGALWVTMLDVGQGLSLVIRTAHHALVYDAGGRFSSRFDAGQASVVPYLRQAGIQNLDMLVVSHGDSDHFGGVSSVVNAYPPNQILTSVPDRIPDSIGCRAGQRWSWDGVRFEMLGPLAGDRLRGNDKSCVLKIEGPTGSVLLPGDIGRRAEHALMLENYDDLRSDLLVVPHHGSRTSSSESFLDAVRPAGALLSTGYRNRFHHPHPDVMSRYRERGIVVVNSADAGAVEWKFETSGISVSGYRYTHRRYWNDLRPDSLFALAPL